MSSLFPITEYWSWGTFLLYIVVSLLVCKCCKNGAVWRARENSKSTTASRFELRNSSLYYFIAFAILVLLGTLRTVEVGSDTQVYIEYFDNHRHFDFYISTLFSFNQMEPGFQLYLSLIKSISSNYTFLFLINSILVAFAYISYVKFFFDEKSNYTFLQIFIFYYVSNMSGMRSALATVFLLFSFIQLAKGKYIKSIVLTLIACSFHYTMLFNLYVIVMTFLSKSKGSRRRKWLWIVSLVITVVVAFSSTYSLRGIFAGTKYSYYTERLESQSFLGSLFFIIYGIFAFGSYRYFTSSSLISKKIRSIYLVTLAFLIIYPALFVTGAYRIPNYYILPRLTVWGEMEEHYQDYIYEKKIYRFFLQIIVIVYLLFRFTRTSVDGGFIYHWII